MSRWGAALRRLLAGDPDLEELRLGECSRHAPPLPCQQAAAAAPAQRGLALELAEAMASTASPLRAVSLVGCGMDDEALPSLIAAVEQCAALERLDLRHCFLTKGAVEALQLAAVELRRAKVLHSSMAYYGTLWLASTWHFIWLTMAYYGLLWLTMAWLTMAYYG